MFKVLTVILRVNISQETMDTTDSGLTAANGVPKAIGAADRVSIVCNVLQLTNITDL